jgi:hypothetical protein
LLKIKDDTIFSVEGIVTNTNGMTDEQLTSTNSNLNKGQFAKFTFILEYVIKTPGEKKHLVIMKNLVINLVKEKSNREFKNLDNLTKDFKYYKKNILDSLDKFEAGSLSVIDDALVAKFGNDFRATVRKDFGLRDLDAFNKRVFENFRDSVKNWVNNRYYDVSQSNFGAASEIRFDDCEQYPFAALLNEIQNILNNCIVFNVKSLKRRSVNYTQIPKEFGIVELRKQIQDNLDSFSTRVDIKKNVYSPGAATATVSGTQILPPITKVVEVPVVVDPPKPPVAPKVEPPQPPVTPPPAKVAPPTVATTPKPNLQDTRFSTAEQQAIGLTVTNSGNRSYTRYVPPGLDGTTNNFNGFDTRGFEDVDTDITGRDF